MTRPYAIGVIEQLTSREVEVLTMMAAGQSNKAIAGTWSSASTRSRNT